MHLAIDVPAYTQASIYLTGTQNSLAIWRNHTDVNDNDTIYRSGIVSISAGSTIQLISDYQTLEQGYLSYWAGFRLNNYFSPLIAFYVVLSQPTFYANILNTWLYDVTLANIGNGWTGQSFITPLSGIYFFTCGSGIVKGIRTSGLNLYVNGIVYTNPGYNVLTRILTSASNVDFLARSWFISLNSNTSVVAGLQLNVDSRFTDPIHQQIYYSGFFYSPVTNQQVQFGKNSAICLYVSLWLN